jgi:undecaprenyl diphosphate synthase
VTAGTDGARARYVAIITDGNGRWAQRRGLPALAGHEAGAETVRARLRDAVDLGIQELTVYSFSTENWTRPREEVDGLMAMMARRIEAETPELHDEGVRMRFVGFRTHLYAPDMHDPDLIIRTSGEQRISNYLLWQGAYAELVFRDELWPDFSREALEQSLDDFTARSRRFGGR